MSSDLILQTRRPAYGSSSCGLPGATAMAVLGMSGEPTCTGLASFGSVLIMTVARCTFPSNPVVSEQGTESIQDAILTTGTL